MNRMFDRSDASQGKLGTTDIATSLIVSGKALAAGPFAPKKRRLTPCRSQQIGQIFLDRCFEYLKDIKIRGRHCNWNNAACRRRRSDAETQDVPHRRREQSQGIQDGYNRISVSGNSKEEQSMTWLENHLH